MAELTSEEKIMKAVEKLKNGKAGGSSGIFTEMVKVACCEEDFLALLMELVHSVWRESRVQVTGLMQS